MDFSLYTISQKNIFSLKYLIEDDQGLIYTGRRTFFNKTCFLYDLDGQEVFRVKRELAFFKTKMTVLYEDHVFATIESKSMRKFVIRTADIEYQIHGKFLKGEFTILKDQREIAKISRKRLSSKQKMGVAIQENEDDELILALALMIEAIARNRGSKSG